MNYNLVILYKKRWEKEKYDFSSDTGERYRIFSRNTMTEVMKTNSKSELYIWMDLNGLKLGRHTCDKSRCRNFKDYTGLAIDLIEKK